MKQRILSLLKISLIFLTFFLACKILFLLFYFNQTQSAGFFNALLVFYHGFRMDFSTLGYVLTLPLLLLIISTLLRKDIFKSALKYYGWVLIICFAILISIDLELYQYWGFRLDITPIIYVKSPQEALASLSTWVIIRQVLLAILLSVLFIYFFNRLFKNVKFESFKIWELPIYVFLTAFLIIPIRGGIGLAPMNVGSVYFSNNLFLNHASINVFWNIGNSMSDLNPNNQQYNFYKTEISRKIIHPYLNHNDTTTIQWVHATHPNIVLIMMESFTANIVQVTGGMPEVTPNLNQLSKEGLLFTNLYAAGDRSDKGLVAILAGFPAQTSFSVIKDAARTQRMPKLPAYLKSMGYKSSFYYGGDINFANMKSFLVSAGFDQIISKDNFDPKDYNSKWGAHDEIVFSQLYKDMCHAQAPFFKMIFTLSSHEPFEVPGKTWFSGDDLNSKFLNSAHYTDRCIGDFIRKARNLPSWKNTWFILVADHGVKMPKNLQVFEPSKFHIPMLWLGGVIDRPSIISKTASQVDIASTILNQLGLHNTNFIFSRNIFSQQATDAFYIFNNGIGLITDTSKYVFDNNQKKVIYSEGKNSVILQKAAKAYLQTVYEEIRH